MIGVWKQTGPCQTIKIFWPWHDILMSPLVIWWAVPRGGRATASAEPFGGLLEKILEKLKKPLYKRQKLCYINGSLNSNNYHY